jgi:hypothetical protein
LTTYRTNHCPKAHSSPQGGGGVQQLRSKSLSESLFITRERGGGELTTYITKHCPMVYSSPLEGGGVRFTKILDYSRGHSGSEGSNGRVTRVVKK